MCKSSRNIFSRLFAEDSEAINQDWENKISSNWSGQLYWFWKVLIIVKRNTFHVNIAFWGEGRVEIISPPIQNPESGREKRKFAFIAATPEMTALQEWNDFSFIFH